MFRRILGFLLFQLIESSNSLNKCFCDERTAISNGQTSCQYKVYNNEKRFHDGCECIYGFNRPYINSRIVSCLPINTSTNSLKCFCDQRTAFKVENEMCIASISTDGTIEHKSGCQCIDLESSTQIFREFFLKSIYIVKCVSNNESSYQIEDLINLRQKREVNTNELTTNDFESSTMELTTEPSTTQEITTTLLPTTEEITTELSTTEEPSTTTEEITTTTELLTTQEEESTTESSTRRTSTAALSSTTSNTTVISIITSTVESNGEINFGTCNATSFDKKNKQTAEILLYFASGWVIVWVLLIILVNLYCRSWGHHRFLDFLQELGLIAVFVFMGFFVLRPDFTGVCKATKLVLQFFLMYFLLNAIMQAFFLNGLVKGRSTKNSCVPWVFNYTLPPLIAGGLTAGFYFWMKSDYENNEVHCFVEIYTDLYWTFVFPAWIFGFIAIFFNQTSITACKMSRNDVNLDQLFWAKKMCRGLPIFTAWFCMCFFLLLFGIDMQRVWIIGVYMGLAILFGPVLFILHTFCYEKTAVKLFTKTGMSFYKPCPQKKSEAKNDETNTKVDLRKKHPMTDPIIPVKGPIEKAGLPPQPIGAISTLSPPMDSTQIGGYSSNLEPLEYDPTSPQELYNWLTDKTTENVNGAENVLFKSSA